jgi:hypothetical protein
LIKKKKKKRKIWCIENASAIFFPPFSENFHPKISKSTQNSPHLTAHCSSPATALHSTPAPATSQIFPSPPYKTHPISNAHCSSPAAALHRPPAPATSQIVPCPPSNGPAAAHQDDRPTRPTTSPSSLSLIYSWIFFFLGMGR